MHSTEYNKTRVIKYLIFTFTAAYLIQFFAARICNRGDIQIGQMIIAAIMFIPTLGVLFSGAGLRDMGWKLQLRKNIKSILIAWFAPAVLTVIGAALYFLLFPGHFDLTGKAMAASGGAETLAQLEAQGISYPMYVLISVISAVTYAPLINVIPALGEEIGWRGFLYPQLRARFGRQKGWILGGAIWGAWHWPLIYLIGYEYGTGYVGFPVSGMLLFCVVTVGWGILHAWLYERSGTIWVPALFHGTINAFAGIPLVICLPDIGSGRLLGPAPNGIIAALPFLIWALIVLLRAKDPEMQA